MQRQRRRLERRLIAATLSVVALHTLLDTAVAPERGTTATSHLAATIVPLAVIGLVAPLHSRLRPGARAVVAAALGAWCLVGAILAVVDARATFERASDWTGFLLAPAGLALLALAVWLGWSTRKGGRHRYLRRAGVSFGALVITYWLVVPVSMGLIATHRPRAAAAEMPAGYRSVSLRTSDGLRLAAWYAPSQNGAAVISFPTRTGKLDHAAMLRRHGYGVLMVDMRGYDGSDGSANAFGWAATKDVDAAVSWLRHQPDVREGRLGGIGFSVGGEMMLQAAAQNHELRAVVSDGAGERSVRETWLRGIRGALAIPEAAVQSAAVAIYSDTLPPPSLKAVAARIAPTAAFFVYAERGLGGEDLNSTYFHAAHAPKAIWKVPEAGHTGGLAARPEGYERRVIGFFDRHLLRPACASTGPRVRGAIVWSGHDVSRHARVEAAAVESVFRFVAGSSGFGPPDARRGRRSKSGRSSTCFATATSSASALAVVRGLAVSMSGHGEEREPVIAHVEAAHVSLLRWLRRQLRQPSPLREHLEAAVEHDDPAEARRLVGQLPFNDAQRRNVEQLLDAWARTLENGAGSSAGRAGDF